MPLMNQRQLPPASAAAASTQSHSLWFGLKPILAFFCAATLVHAQQDLSNLAVLRPELRSGFANGAWKYDRYKHLESLDANRRIVVADLKGPGIIRHLHVTRHFPPELMARGIVLEIRFDDAAEPAVCCPLADFFGDGCNGKEIGRASCRERV
mgnify:FL=1